MAQPTSDQPEAPPSEADKAAPAKATARPADPAAAELLLPAGWGWTRRNVAALAVLVIALGGLIDWRAVQNRALLGPDLQVMDCTLAPAGEMIDPNTATWTSLARLPGLGEAKAKAIVDYSRRWADTHDGRPAFICPADLQGVPGIGPTITREIAPYLTFPAASTRPADAMDS